MPATKISDMDRKVPRRPIPMYRRPDPRHAKIYPRTPRPEPGGRSDRHDNDKHCTPKPRPTRLEDPTRSACDKNNTEPSPSRNPRTSRRGRTRRTLDPETEPRTPENPKFVETPNV